MICFCHSIVQHIIRRGHLGSSSLGCIIAVAFTIACRYKPTYVHGRPLRRKYSVWIPTQRLLGWFSFGKDHHGSAGPGGHDAPTGPALASLLRQSQMHRSFHPLLTCELCAYHHPRTCYPWLNDRPCRIYWHVVCTIEGFRIGQVGITTRQCGEGEEEAGIASKSPSPRTESLHFLTIDLQIAGGKVHLAATCTSIVWSSFFFRYVPFFICSIASSVNSRC